MTSELVALAQRLVQAPRWRWMPGMSWPEVRVERPRGGGWVRSGGRFLDAERTVVPVDAYPDLSDPATVGCLLGLVREAWGFPHLYPVRITEGHPPGVWTVGPVLDHRPHREGWGFQDRCVKEAELARRVGLQSSEAAALAMAMLEAP